MFRPLCLRLLYKTTNRSFKYRYGSTYFYYHCFSHFQPTLKNNKFSICVEGNIGAGKSHMLEYFKNEPGVEIYSEPVKKWQNVHGSNILDLMYQDSKRWGLSFQTYVQLTMLQTHMKKTTQSVKLMERSIFSAKYIFVENLYKNGMMKDVEYHILTEWFNWIVNNLDVNLDLIVYLRTSPETVLQRIQKRNRREERNISLDFLKSLHVLHEDWLLHRKYRIPAEIMVLDADKGIEEMMELFQNSRNKILCQ